MKGRRHTRRVVACPARIVAPDGRVVACTVQDVSETGARLALPDAASIPASFTLSFGPQREVRAEVRWRHDQEIGVVFGR